jgi:spoIIIJ-associated protein
MSVQGGIMTAIEKATQILEGLLKEMGIEAGVSANEVPGDYIALEITTPDSALVIGRQGKTLGALQYLVNLIINKEQEEERIKVILDIEGYRGRRREKLMELAQKLAQRAKEGNTEVFLEPMNSYERRIIHTALAEDPDVETTSVGEGVERQVVITAKTNISTDEEMNSQ